MVLLELSMSPMDKGESVGAYVAKILKVIDESGLDYRLNSMGTVIEGEWDDVMRVVTQCFNTLKQECNRISISMKADYRKSPKGRLDSKVADVEQKARKIFKK